MEQTPLEATPSFAAPGKNKINKRFIYLSIAVIVLLLLFFGFRALTSNNNSNINEEPAVITPTDVPIETETPTPIPSESPTPSPTSTPTPKPTGNPVDSATGLNRSNLSVTVQNGSGEAGVASKASDILKSLGYNVVLSGNADNFDYTNVSVQVKSADSAFINLLKKDLGSSYTIGSTSANLSNSFSSDALVIIGK